MITIDNDEQQQINDNNLNPNGKILMSDFRYKDPKTKSHKFLNYETSSFYFLEYSLELLNIINTLIIYFFISFYICQVNYNDILIWINVDIFGLFVFIFYIINNRTLILTYIHFTLLFASIALITSVFISKFTATSNFISQTQSILAYIKLNYLCFSIPFILSYNYLGNEETKFTISNKLFIMILAFIISNIDVNVFSKIRSVCHGFYLLDFFPILRKKANALSRKWNIGMYLLQLCWSLMLLWYIGEGDKVVYIIGFNITLIVLYPFWFDLIVDAEFI
jgi:hypothetical protein